MYVIDDFDLGGAFTCGIIGGFINEAAREEDEQLERLEKENEYNGISENYNDDKIKRLENHGSSGPLSIYDDYSCEEDMTEIRENINEALSFAASRLKNKEKTEDEEG
jgi:hypothetical protein